MIFSWAAGNAALRSVGTALTLSSTGFYLHSRGFISDEATKAFGRYIQQVGLPLYFFTKLVECPAATCDSALVDDSTNKNICPNVLDHWADAWILLIWPLYVIAWGLLVGYTVAWFCQAPTRQHRTIMLCTAFANSGSLPTTLLSVLHDHAQRPSGNKDSSLDPNTFLSLYLILFPMLTWSFGYWLATPPPSPVVADVTVTEPGSATRSQGHAVSTDEFMELSDASFRDCKDEHLSQSLRLRSSAAENRRVPERNEKFQDSINEQTLLLRSDAGEPPSVEDTSSLLPPAQQRLSFESSSTTCLGMLYKWCQPPVIGSLLGLVVTSTVPLRALLALDTAPLDWWFGGLSRIGTSSIPISMSVLGMHLSGSILSQRQQGEQHAGKGGDNEGSVVPSSFETFGWRTMTGIIVGKLIIMPVIGFSSFWLLRHLGPAAGVRLANAPPSLCLVLLIVWIPPTANNAVVIADLAGGMREAVAQLMVREYLVVPIILSFTMAIVIHMSGLTVAD